MGWNEDVKKIVEFIPRFESIHRDMITMDKENSRINKLIDSYSASLKKISLKVDGISESINNTNKRIDELEKRQGYDDSELRSEFNKKIELMAHGLEQSISELNKEINSIEVPGNYDDSGLVEGIKKLEKEAEHLGVRIEEIKEKSKTSASGEDLLELESKMKEFTQSIKSNVEKSLKSFGAVEIAGLRKEMANISRNAGKK